MQSFPFLETLGLFRQQEQQTSKNTKSAVPASFEFLFFDSSSVRSRV
jgi:hypothetical protein